MIKVTIKEAAQKRKVENSSQLARLMECEPTIDYRNWTGKQQPGLEMIDRICAALDCDIGDVIKRTRGNGAKVPARRKAR
jgi:DNA-binding Xre family transcriptional regulator